MRKRDRGGRRRASHINECRDYNVYRQFKLLQLGQRRFGTTKTSVGCTPFCQVLRLCLHKEGIGSGILFGEVFV